MNDQKLIKESREIFENSVGFCPDIVSTIDHAFSSPPLRILDSHLRIMNTPNSMLILWDLTKPTIRRYRTELTLDTGLYTKNDEHYYLFNQKQYSFESCLLSPNYEAQLSNVKKTLSLLQLRKEYSEAYIERLNRLISIYKDIDSNIGSFFYKRLIHNYYLLFCQDKLAKFIDENMKSLYYSGIIDKYIPELIKSTWTTKYGLKKLLNGSFFTKPILRNCTKRDKQSIISLLSEKADIPSSELILWSFALSNIKHFGSDRGFLQDKKFFEDIQVTKGKDDGDPFVNFKTINTFSLFNEKLIRAKTKFSRISNFSNAYLHLGDNIVDIIENFVKSHSIYEIEMGKILI